MMRSRWKGELLLTLTQSSARKPQCYARLVRDVSLRGVVSFGTHFRGHRRSFCGPTETG